MVHVSGTSLPQPLSYGKIGFLGKMLPWRFLSLAHNAAYHHHHHHHDHDHHHHHLKESGGLPYLWAVGTVAVSIAAQACWDSLQSCRLLGHMARDGRIGVGWGVGERESVCVGGHTCMGCMQQLAEG